MHVKVFTMLRVGYRRTALVATKEATVEINKGDKGFHQRAMRVRGCAVTGLGGGMRARVRAVVVASFR